MRPLPLNSDFRCARVLMTSDVYVFTLSTEVTGKTIIEPEDEIEENKLTKYLRTSSG